MPAKAQSRLSWLRIARGVNLPSRRGTSAPDPANYVRVDHVEVRFEDRWYSISGSIVTLCRWHERKRYTIYRGTIRDGVHPLWLVAENGLALRLTEPRAKGAAA